ncbi:Sugar or nucleoside kinase, ribokinase family [Bryocella elongata]|uniref:Sugar or nucleoside kinase, ribokinase family n=1 Tax=Bryocella elongata TaxID=863522 RepID=A0A1H5UUZ2_9BACT|nr:PfkB family carbohydrate kinase [Bryocella elongata]SEF78291.1 Sugar or nucleoside kinase, ribokinase family [Bryocella elongata]
MAIKQASTRNFDLVIFGEFFSDMVFYNLRAQPRFGEEVKTDSFLIAPGGGLATAAIAASRLGSATGILTRVGADAPTLPTWNQILGEGLDTSACSILRDQPTALTVSIAYGSNRMMVTHEPINHQLEEMLAQPPVQAKLQRARHVHFACALRRPRAWAPVMRKLREEGITVSADFGWNPELSPTQLHSIVKDCQFIFPNEHEAKAITGASDASRALERLQDWVRVPVIKLGKRGAMLMAGGKVYRQPTLPIPVVDATGAGDAFDGGFLHAFLHGGDWDTCLRAGNICSSLSASQPGGSQGLPNPKEFRRHMAELKAQAGRMQTRG